MTIDALPIGPSTLDPTHFSAEGDALIAALPKFITQANAVAVAMNLNSTTDTSASSITVGTGAKTFTVTAGKSFQPGMYLVIADTAAPSTNSMYGQITSYSGTTLVMNIISVLGSGTKTAWTISQSAANMDIAGTINGAPSKGTPVGTDILGGADSAAGFSLAKFTFASVLSYLSTYLAQIGGSVTQVFSMLTAAVGTNTTQGATTAFVMNQISVLATNLLYISGFNMTTAGGTTSQAIGAGQASNNSSAIVLNLAAISKTTAAWVVGSGNGGIDTGAIAAGGKYYFFVIRRPDTGVVDACFSASPSAPTFGVNIPSAYTQYKYLGMNKTDGSSNWLQITQVGREFAWGTPPLDVTTAASTILGVIPTMSVPVGRKVKWLGNVISQAGVYISDPANADMAYSATIAPLGSEGQMPSQVACWTDTAARIRYRAGINGTLYIVTTGWIDLADSQ
jgi:hypothetical protein